MIIGIVGNRGSGKTLFMAILGVLFWLNGYHIYSNFKFKGIPFVNMDAQHDLLDIKTRNNIFLFDEIYMLADSRNSGSPSNRFFSQKIMQSRKIGGGGKNIVVVSSPMFDTADKRIRGLVDIIMEPTVMLKDRDEKPLLLMLEYFNTNQDRKKIRKFYIPTQFGKLDIPNMYDTYQDIDQMDDGVDALRVKLIKKYWDTEIGKKTALSSIMRINESGCGLQSGDFSAIADYILTMRQMGESPPK